MTWGCSMKWILTVRRGEGESVALPRPTRAMARPFTYSCSAHTCTHMQLSPPGHPHARGLITRTHKCCIKNKQDINLLPRQGLMLGESVRLSNTHASVVLVLHGDDVPGTLRLLGMGRPAPSTGEPAPARSCAAPAARSAPGAGSPARAAPAAPTSRRPRPSWPLASAPATWWGSPASAARTRAQRLSQQGRPPALPWGRSWTSYSQRRENVAE